MKKFSRYYDAGADASASAECARLLARGRRVRLRYTTTPDGDVLSVEALDADPYANGWREYGQRREAWRKWATFVIVGLVPAMYMLGRAGFGRK